MLLHGYTPTDLLKSSIISIPKDVQVSLSIIDNYRGIALFNCICKLYDNVTLFLYGNYLSTSTIGRFYYEKSTKTLYKYSHDRLEIKDIRCIHQGIERKKKKKGWQPF